MGDNYRRMRTDEETESENCRASQRKAETKDKVVAREKRSEEIKRERCDGCRDSHRRGQS